MAFFSRVPLFLNYSNYDSMSIKDQGPPSYCGKGYGQVRCYPGTKKGFLALSQNDTFTRDIYEPRGGMGVGEFWI